MQSILLEKGSKEVGFEICGEIMSTSDFDIVTRTHACLSYSFSGQIYLQLGVLEKKYMKFGSEKIVSLTCFEIVAWPHTRVSYSFLGSIFFILNR